MTEKKKFADAIHMIDAYLAENCTDPEWVSCSHMCRGFLHRERIRLESEAVWRDAIEHNGEDTQLNVAVEEMAELTKEIIKHKRGVDNLQQLAEEIADVEIMLEQLKLIFGVHTVVIIEKERKKDRLRKRLVDGEES